MLLDVGVGILVAIAGSELFNVPLTASIILWAIFFSLLPDIDVLPDIPELMKYRRKVGGFLGFHRQSISHLPIIYLLVSILALIFFGPFWAFLFFFSTFSHLLHDSTGIGWGVKWLWPFKKNSYKFFADNRGRPSKNFLISWNEERLKSTIEQYGNPRSILDTYLRPTPTLIIETAVFLISLAALYLHGWG